MDGGPGPLLHVRLLHYLEKALSKAGHPSLLTTTDVFAGTSDGALISLFLAKKLTDEPNISGTALAKACVHFTSEYTQAFSAELERRKGLLSALRVPGYFVDEVLPLIWKSRDSLSSYWKGTKAAPSTGTGMHNKTALKTERQPGPRKMTLDEALKKLKDELGSLHRLPDNLWSLREILLGRGPLIDKQPFPFKDVLDKHFGGMTLGELRRKVVITAFDTTDWAPRLFRNFGQKEDVERDSGIKLVEVALCSSALPTIMPIHTLNAENNEKRRYFDGVFVANNPSTSALTLVMDGKPENHQGQPFSGKLEDVRLLSLGASQASEEANLETQGGFWNFLIQLFAYKREVRIYATLRSENRDGYLKNQEYQASLNSQEFRTELEERGEKEKLGWFAFLRRPTFIPNVLLHGHNREVTRQGERLLCGNLMRFEPRINLMRDMFLIFFHRKCSATTLIWTAKRIFKSYKANNRPYSYDEKENLKAFTEGATNVRKWIQEKWLGLPSADAACTGGEKKPQAA
jgi:patatin-like phospholipase/acyl hydrolase